MLESIQIGEVAPNFISIGVYKNRLGKNSTFGLSWKKICYFDFLSS